MESQLQQNWDNGVCKRFEIPSADHPDEAHEDIIYAIHLRGHYLVSGSRDKTVRIWDIETQRMLRQPLRSHEGPVLCVQFDDGADQDVIISGSVDTSFVVWRFSTGTITRKIDQAHQESILNLCFDNEYLVTGSKDKTIKIWNRRELKRDGQVVQAYSELRCLKGHIAAVNDVKIHGDTLVSGSGDRTINIWDIHTGQILRTLREHTKGIACLQYTGNHIVSGSSDDTIRIFDLAQPEDKTQIACLEGHTNLVRAVQVQMSNEGTQVRRIVSGSYDSSVKIWMRDDNLSKWTTRLTLSPRTSETEQPNRVFRVQLDERKLLCCTQSRVITGWDFASSAGTAERHEMDAT